MAADCPISQRYITLFDHALTTYVTGAVWHGTLDECQRACINGTLPSCVGFTRYAASFGVESDSAADCWWTDDSGLFTGEDYNDNEDLFRLVDCPPQSHDSCSNSSFYCAPETGAGSYAMVAGRAWSSAAASYSYSYAGLNVQADTLAGCFDSCTSGRWEGCVGFSRSRMAAASATAACWWVSAESDLIHDSASSQDLYIRYVPPPRCVGSCLRCGGYHEESDDGRCLLGTAPPNPPPSLPPAHPSPPAYPPAICVDSCNADVVGARVGVCDDAPDGVCATGTDCADCGPRILCVPGVECPTECFERSRQRPTPCLRGFIGNGQCDDGCNSRACGNDGGDCSDAQIAERCVRALPMETGAAAGAAEAPTAATTPAAASGRQHAPPAVALRLDGISRLRLRARCGDGDGAGCENGVMTVSSIVRLSLQWRDSRLFESECFPALPAMMSLPADLADKPAQRSAQQAHVRSVLYVPPLWFDNLAGERWPHNLLSARFELNRSLPWIVSEDLISSANRSSSSASSAAAAACTDCATYAQELSIRVAQGNWDFYRFPFDWHVVTITLAVRAAALHGCGPPLARALRDAAGTRGTLLLPADGSWMLRTLPGEHSAFAASLDAEGQCVVRIGLARNAYVYAVKNLFVLIIIVQAALLSLWLEPRGPLIGVRFSTMIFAMVLIALSNRSSKDVLEAVGTDTALMWIDWFNIL